MTRPSSAKTSRARGVWGVISVLLFLGCGAMQTQGSTDSGGNDAGSRVDEAGRPDGASADDGSAAPDAIGTDAAVETDGATIDAGRETGTVDLRSAGAFAVLGGSTVTSTGLTVITGDVGISPGGALTGFPPGVLIGTLHLGDAESAQALLDLTSAYNDAMGRMTAPVTVDGNLGGRTLPSGLYWAGSSLEITSGDLTLDAGGDENAVWIFQMGSSFTMTSGRRVILVGGARAANVYWQVGSSATLGSGAEMVGNFMADQSITLETGARLDGRALTRIGAVTLDSNVVTLPMP